MAERNNCPQCGRTLPPSTPQGLCPACLLKRGLEPNTVGYTDPTHAGPRWEPPTVEALAAGFPELDVLELIGRGGMGAVYKARQKELDRLVAVKVLPPEIARQEAFAQRFAREAQAMARLSHPNIVAIYDFGLRGELYFFLMEYVDGLSLRQVLDAGGVAAKEALAIVPQICDALQYAHDRGIVHRDIKPENILLDRRGQVKIADFGLAKLVGLGMAQGPLSLDGRGQGEGGVSQAERVMGTPHYMAPEQIQRPREVDHRADIYSLGVVFYQMLTGELPRGKFEPPSHKVLIDVRLDEVVLRALQHEPQRRYQQVSQVRTEVETIVATAQGTGEVAPQRPGAGDAPGVRVGLEWNNRKRTAFLPLVVARDGRRIIYWPGVVVASVITAALISAGAFLFDLVLYRLSGVSIMGWPFVAIAAGGAILVIGTGIRRAYKLPIEQLKSLETGPGLVEAGPQLELARQELKTPAIGLVVAAGISIAVLFSALLPLALSYAPEPSGTHVEGWVPWAIGLGLLLNVLILFGALRMMKLKSRGEAVAASILAMILSPGNLIGLPMGIWALAVLGRRDVAEAFAAVRSDTSSSPAGGSRKTPGSALATLAFHGALLGLFLGFVCFAVPRFIAPLRDLAVEVPMSTTAAIGFTRFVEGSWPVLFSILLALDAGVVFLLHYLADPRARRVWSICVTMGMLALALGICLVLLIPLSSVSSEIARTEVTASTVRIIEGHVTDAQTGKPIPAAMVTDNLDRANLISPVSQAWTDSQGRYRLQTAGPQDVLVISASGYEIQTADTAAYRPGVPMDFALRPATASSASSPATSAMDRIDQKIEQLHRRGATVEDAVKALGEPEKYLWGDQVFDKNNLPPIYILQYPQGIHVVISSGLVDELRSEQPGPGFSYRGKLRLGSTLAEALAVLGQPSKTVEAGPIGFADSVLYKDIDGQKGDCYYARSDQGVRVFFMGYKVVALYLPVGGDEGDSNTFRPVSAVKDYDDIRFKDLRSIDLSGAPALPATLWFNQKTIWPKLMPAGVDPGKLLSDAMNPGLGVRALHQQGVTGKGVSVAIIDQPLYQDHPEFAGKIAAYHDLGCQSEWSMHGPAVASLLVGTKCGTAPGAKVYYVAAPSWTADTAFQAQALDWIVEQNAKLPPEGKIRVVSVSAAPSGLGSPFTKNTEVWDPACRRAQEAGILVLDCTTHHGFIGPCFYDAGDPEDVAKCKPGFPGMEGRGLGDRLLVPCSRRTTAEERARGQTGYQYCGRGGLSWSIPYAAGVLAMGWQTRPDVGPAEMRDLLLKSAHKTADGATIINPQEFIRMVKAAPGPAKG